MKPARSKDHLAFVRSLPCCVSGRTFGVEAAHVGRRGLGQKCSDFETIPLNALYHREQHRVGLRAFCKSYDLDIPALLTLLNHKPHVTVFDGYYFGMWGNKGGGPAPDNYILGFDCFRLGTLEQGLEFSIRLLKDRVRDLLSDRIRARVREFQAR